MTPEQKKELDSLVWVDPERMSGTPCFRGTRVPVQTLFDYLEASSTLNDFLIDFPSVTREQAAGFLDLATSHLLVDAL